MLAPKLLEALRCYWALMPSLAVAGGGLCSGGPPAAPCTSDRQIELIRSPRGQRGQRLTAAEVGPVSQSDSIVAQSTRTSRRTLRSWRRLRGASGPGLKTSSVTRWTQMLPSATGPDMYGASLRKKSVKSSFSTLYRSSSA